MRRSQLKGILAVVALVTIQALSGCGNNPDTAPHTAAAIAIATPPGAVPVSGTMQFSAIVTDANGNTITATPTWTVVNGGGTITSAGLFTAGDSVGTFANTIVATIGSISSASSVTVSAGALASITVTPDSMGMPVGTTQQFTAVGHDAHGRVVAIPQRAWSAASAAGTIDTSGMFTASTTAGVTQVAVTATSGSISGSAKVIVTPGPLASLTVSPDSISLAVNATHQFTVVGKDAYGNTVAIDPTWHASVGSVTGSGMFTASAAPGPYFQALSATVGDLVAYGNVIVLPGPLASITVTPSTGMIMTMGSVPFTATGHDADGYAVSITPVWSIAPDQSSAGSISQTGMFTASSTPGIFNNAIVATSGSISGTASVQVISMCLPWCGWPMPPNVVPAPPHR